jgi:hypothetical protein
MNRVYNNRGGSFITERRVIKNSSVVAVGGFITDKSTGIAPIADVNEPLLGMITSVLDKAGTNLAQGTAATLSTGSFNKTTRVFTAGSDNQTVDLVAVDFVVAKEGTQFVATLDADKGTTTGSNKEGYYLTLKTSDHTKLAENSATAAIVDATPDVAVHFRIVKATGNGLSAREVVVEPVHRIFVANVK